MTKTSASSFLSDAMFPQKFLKTVCEPEQADNLQHSFSGEVSAIIRARHRAHLN